MLVRFATHFTNGYDLIEAAYEKYNGLARENPAVPVARFGHPEGGYYGEVWVDGMDWQHNYWIVESDNFHDNKALILAVFGHHDTEEVFGHEAVRDMWMGALWNRHYDLWGGKDQYGSYWDRVWWQLRWTTAEATPENGSLREVRFGDADTSVFRINPYLIPDLTKTPNGDPRGD